MYRVNSISKNMITLQVVQDGMYKSVQLLPKNFVLSERKTPQMENLELSKAIRIRVLPDKKVFSGSVEKVVGAVKTVSSSKTETKIDNSVETGSKVTKTANKEK